MRDDGQLIIVCSVLLELGGRKSFMHFTMTTPGNNFDVSLFSHISRKIFIREENNLVGSERFNNFNGIASGAASIRLGFDLG